MSSDENFVIPDEYKKYSKFIDGIINRFVEAFSVNMESFDGADIFNLLTILSSTVSELRDEIEDIKEIDDDDRIALYGVLLSLLIEKSVLSSPKLTDEQKDQVRRAFQSGGFVQKLLEQARKYYQKILTKMDTNKDKKVTKEEYQNYVFKKNKKFCGCVGDEANYNSAKCSANCCFPFLSGGDGIIELDDSDSPTEVEVETSEQKNNDSNMER